MEQDVYAVLGLAPGASAQELKAAYRDLAKVWHPDRFGHDPRLQQKAQEKLKEINDAYQQLLAGRHTRRPQHHDAAPPKSPAATAADAVAVTPQAAARSHARPVWPLAVGAFAVAAAVAFAAPRLWPRQDAAGEAARAEVPARAEVLKVSENDHAERRADERPKAAAKAARVDAADTSPPAAAAPKPELRPIATVRLTIDPTTGLLARADCPHRMAVSFVQGEEPRRHCDARHESERPAAPARPAEAARPKQQQSKSFAERLSSPFGWLRKKKGAPAEPGKESPKPASGN